MKKLLRFDLMALSAFAQAPARDADRAFTGPG